MNKFDFDHRMQHLLKTYNSYLNNLYNKLGLHHLDYDYAPIMYSLYNIYNYHMQLQAIEHMYWAGVYDKNTNLEQANIIRVLGKVTDNFKIAVSEFYNNYIVSTKERNIDYLDALQFKASSGKFLMEMNMYKSNKNITYPLIVSNLLKDQPDKLTYSYEYGQVVFNYLVAKYLFQEYFKEESS